MNSGKAGGAENELHELYLFVERTGVGLGAGIFGSVAALGFMTPWIIFPVIFLGVLVVYFTTAEPYGTFQEQMHQIDRYMVIGLTLGVFLGIVSLESLSQSVSIEMLSYAFTVSVGALVSVVSAWALGGFVREVFGIR